MLFPCALAAQETEPLRERDDPNRAVLLNQILQRYTDNYGGRREVDALNSISISGSQIQDGTEFAFSLRRKRPNLLRYSLRNESVQIDAGFDGRTGWVRTADESSSKVEQLSGEALATLRKEADFMGPLFRLRGASSAQTELLGARRLEGSETYVVRLTQPDTETVLYYLDRKTALLMQVESLDDSGVVRLQTRYSDYRIIDGFPFAFKIENRAGGRTLSSTNVSEIEVNPGLLSIVFRVPSG